MSDTPYMMWLDTNRKRSINGKVCDALNRYQEIHGVWPNDILLNTEYAGVYLRITPGIQVGYRSDIGTSLVYVRSTDHASTRERTPTEDPASAPSEGDHNGSRRRKRNRNH